MQNFSEEEISRLKSFFQMKETPEERENFLIERTKKYIKFLQYIPGICMVGIGNSVAMNTAHKDSDIDLFIITEEKRLWIVRIFSTLFFSLLGIRKTATQHKDKFCLSFFVTEQALDFSKFALKNDIYLYFWVISMKPIFDRGNTYERFIEANKNWINMGEYADIIADNASYRSYLLEKRKRPSQFLDSLDILLKRIFLPATLRHFEKLGKPYGIIISESMLKFHDEDKRDSVRDSIFGDLGSTNV